MSFAVSWHGVSELGATLAKKTDAVHAVGRSAVIEVAHLMERVAKEHAGEGGRHKLGTPTPATPGSGPAVITGTLRRSIIVSDVSAYGLFGWTAKIGPTAIYGRRVELEYDYPYMTPAYEEVKPMVGAIYARHWGEAWRG